MRTPHCELRGIKRIGALSWNEVSFGESHILRLRVSSISLIGSSHRKFYLGRTGMALPEATFLRKTGRYEGEVPLCLRTLSSEAIGNQAHQGYDVITVRTASPDCIGLFPLGSAIRVGLSFRLNACLGLGQCQGNRVTRRISSSQGHSI